MKTYKLIVSTNFYQAQNGKVIFPKHSNKKILFESEYIEDVESELFDVVTNFVSDNCNLYLSLKDFVSNIIDDQINAIYKGLPYREIIAKEDEYYKDHEKSLYVLAVRNGWEHPGLYEDNNLIFDLRSHFIDYDGYTFEILEPEE